MLRFIGSASAPHSKSLVKGFEDAFNTPLLVGYGMTEATCGITLNSNIPRINYSVGNPIDANKISILDENGIKLDSDVEGEVVVEGPNVSDGYLEIDDESGIGLVDGVLKTGDLGFLG